MASGFYPVESRIHGLVTLRRERMLARRGTILVKTGDVVDAGQPIGRYHDTPRWHYLDVSRRLQVSPEHMGNVVKVFPGDIVERGSVLAESKAGLRRRSCRAPITGEVMTVEGGRILLAEQGETVEVAALMDGVVAGVLPSFGVVIETTGSLIKGAWGNGQSAFGPLTFIGGNPAEPLTLENCRIANQGMIMAAGWCQDELALRQLDEVRIRGLVLGSLPAGLLPLTRGLSFPLFLTEGFGSAPMNIAAIQLLGEASGEKVSLIHAGGIRLARGPEILISRRIESSSPALTPPAGLRLGHLVRIIGYPCLGAVGTISALHQTPQRVENGDWHLGVDVDLEGSGRVFVPWTNVEPVDLA